MCCYTYTRRKKGIKTKGQKWLANTCSYSPAIFVLLSLCLFYGEYRYNNTYFLRPRPFRKIPLLMECASNINSVFCTKGSSIKDVRNDTCGHRGEEGSSKSGRPVRPHLVQKSIEFLDHRENHDSKKYKL